MYVPDGSLRSLGKWNMGQYRGEVVMLCETTELSAEMQPLYLCCWTRQEQFSIPKNRWPSIATVRLYSVWPPMSLEKCPSRAKAELCSVIFFFSQSIWHNVGIISLIRVSSEWCFLHDVEVACSGVQLEECLEVQSWDDVRTLFRLEGTKHGAMVSILPVGIDPCMGYPFSQSQALLPKELEWAKVAWTYARS